jgi:hypothetical protein
MGCLAGGVRVTWLHVPLSKHLPREQRHGLPLLLASSYSHPVLLLIDCSAAAICPSFSLPPAPSSGPQDPG